MRQLWRLCTQSDQWCKAVEASMVLLSGSGSGEAAIAVLFGGGEGEKNNRRMVKRAGRQLFLCRQVGTG